MAEDPTSSQQQIQGDYNASAQGGGDATVNVTNIYQATLQPVSSAYREIAGVPPPTDQQFIEQRTTLVEAIAARLLQPQVNALVLTGIGGVGKSTLAALLYRHAQTHQQSGTGLFAALPLWLSVDRSATFADIVGSLFHQLDKALPDLASLSPANQAVALFNLLDTLEVPHFVVLDQFENLLDWSTGFALPTRAGVGEWLDALNSQPWTGRSRVLLTSRPRPKGTREYPPIYVQEYPVDGLTLAEGIDLLQKRGVQAAETELRRAVESCNGHALSLTLLVALVQEYGISLASLLAETGLWEGDIATNLLDAVFQQLSETQRELLRAFSVFRRPVPLAAAQELISSEVVDQVLPALRGLLVQHLIQRAGDGSYQLHAIVASYTRQHFIEGDRQANQQAVQQAYAKAAAYYLQQAQTTCPPREQRHSLSEVQPIIEAVWHYTQAAQWQEAYTLIEEEDLFEQLSLWGGNVLLLELCQLLLPREGWQPAPEQEATLCNYLGQVHDVLGQKQEALDYFQQALAICREVGDRRGEGLTLNNLGLVYDSLDKKQQALDYFQQALDIRREVGDRRGEGLTLNNLGRVIVSLGKEQQALDYFQQALVICREVGDRRGEGATFHNLGRVYSSLGQKQEALDYFQQALTICREVDDRGAEGTILNNLGRVYNDLGQKQEALDYFQQALTICREVGDRRGEGATFHNLGRVYNDLGQKQEALDYFQQALAIRREVGDRGGEGLTLDKLGLVYDSLGQKQQALDYFQQALAIHREVGNRRGEGRTLNNLGVAQNSLGQKQQALGYYQQALAINREDGDRGAEGITLWNIGSFFFQVQDDVALAAFLLARETFKEVQSPSYLTVQEWIDALHNQVGEQQFAFMLTQVEPHAQQLVEQALSKKQR